MNSAILGKFKSLPSVLILSTMGLFCGMNSVNAQQNPPTCEAPKGGEYLLLVVSPTTDNQTQLKRVLPAKINTNTCRYLSDIVTRIGGFKNIDDANRWARYIKDSAGLSAIITTKPTETPTPTQVSTVSYKPRNLGTGYAVLVDYYNRPQLVSDVRKAVKGDVGFVAYGKRPYLLANYTNNQKEAYETLQELSKRGFFAIIVDSQKVMLLRSAVKLPN
ncbi:MAG: hypothetical protein IGS23_16175 [Rivularia sp. T60_A2020_040]|nr:hypothetical protein [Rivularia sp. T60_A2020_040]